MPNTIIQLPQGDPAPSLIPDRLDRLTDDECLTRLVTAVTQGDSEHLDELVQLIGRLAVVIE